MATKIVGYECPYCGAKLTIAPESTHCKCRYCDAYIEIHRDSMVQDFNNAVNNTRNSSTTRTLVTVLGTLFMIVFVFPIIALTFNFMGSGRTQTQQPQEIVYKDIDIQKDSNVSFSGYNGFANATVSVSKEHGLSEYLVDKVDITPKENLKNGDIVHIKYTMNDEQLEKYHYNVYNIEFDVTVNGLNSFITSFDEEQELFTNLQTIAQKEIDNQKVFAGNKPNEETTIQSQYLGYVIDVEQTGKESLTYLVYQIDVVYPDVTQTFYIPIYFTNIYKDINGNVVSDYKPQFPHGFHSYGTLTSAKYFSYYGYETLMELKLQHINNARSNYIVYTDLEIE